MQYAICKNEEERFGLVKENYNGNMPEIIKQLSQILISPSGTRYKLQQLDYGASGISLSKEEVVTSLQTLLDKEEILPWLVEDCKELMEFFSSHEDSKFMYVVYEI